MPTLLARRGAGSTLSARGAALALFAFLTAMLAVGPAPAAAQDQVNVAVLGLQEILRESSAAKTVLAEVQKREQALKAEIEQKENALLAADQQLAQQRGTLSAEEFAQKRADLTKQGAELRKYWQTQQAQIAELARNGESKIRAVLREIVGKVAKEKGIMLVLNKSQVVLYPTELDITDVVMEQLNAQLPSVSLTN